MKQLSSFQKVDVTTRHFDSKNFKKLQTSSKPIKFAFFADPQLGILDSYNPDPVFRKTHGLPEKVPGISNNGSYFHNELEIVDKTIKYLNENDDDLDFIVVLGDMVNQYPKGAVHQKMNQTQLDEWAVVNSQQVAALQNSFKSSNTPIFVIPGNHDLGNSFYNKAVNEYVQQWGADYFYFKIQNSLFLFLNTQIWRNLEYWKSVNSTNGQDLFQNQDKFIKKVLQKYQDSEIQNVYVFQHQPMFKNHENDNSFETQKYNSYVPTFYKNRFFDDLRSYLPNASLKIFSGHKHNVHSLSDDGQQIISSSLITNYNEDNKRTYKEMGGVHFFEEGKIYDDDYGTEFVNLNDF